MIAMHYSFTLPADYDMAIIERRIAEKGPRFDGFPLLRFKAFLSARKTGGPFVGTDNLYAPFYVWDHPDGLSNFLTSPGFAGLVSDFGRPQVLTWMVWQASIAPGIAEARYATKQVVGIGPDADLAALRAKECEAAESDVAQAGALAAVAAFEPGNWNLVRFRLWRDLPATRLEPGQVYTIGHISLPST